MCEREREIACVHVYVCALCEGSISTGGSQGLVYRRLEAANVLHGGTVRLHRFHVLVEDGEDLVVEDLVLPNAVGHLLQGLSKKPEEKGNEFGNIKKCVCVCVCACL